MTNAQLLAKASELYERLDSYEYGTSRDGGQFEVNVKCYAWGDIDKAIAEAKTPPEYIERAKAWLGDNSIDIWEQYLEFERDYTIDFLGGCSLGSPEDDNKNDKMLRHALDLVDIKSAGFYGRGGGHFCFMSNISTYDLEQVMDQLEGGEKYFSRAEMHQIIKSIEYDLECIDYLKGYIKSMVPDDSSITSEYAFRLSDALESWESESYCVSCHQLSGSN